MRAFNGSYFGNGEGLYLLSNTLCGDVYITRNYLLHCASGLHVGVRDYTSECLPGHDAGVICEGM